MKYYIFPCANENVFWVLSVNNIQSDKLLMIYTEMHVKWLYIFSETEMSREKGAANLPWGLTRVGGVSIW